MFISVLASAALLSHADLLAQNARDWRRAGFSESDARRWIDAGLSLEEAAPYADLLGMSAVERASRFKSVGLTEKLAREWLAAFDIDQFDSLRAMDTAAAYLERGLDFQAAMQWQRARIPPAEVAAWVATTATPELAGAWRLAGYQGQPGSARGGVPPLELLTEYGFDPSSYQKWAWFIRDHSVETAAAWMRVHIEPEIAVIYAEAGGAPADAERVRSTCGHHPVRGQGSVYELNPFVTEGRCFQVAGVVHQLLGRSIALVVYPWNPALVIRVDFTPNTAPAKNSGFVAVAQGRAPYRYTTVAGADRIVADVVALTMCADSFSSGGKACR